MDRTGVVTLTDFDRGIMGLIGATLRPGPDGKPGYWLQVPDIEYEPDADRVRAYVVPPEQVIRKYILPSVLIRQGEPEAAMARWQGGQATEYRTPAVGAREVTVTDLLGTVSGYTAYEEKPQALPMDIPYDIQLLARYSTDSRKMWQAVMEALQRSSGIAVCCQVPVVDSLGDTRYYLGVVQSFEISGEVSDVMRRRAMHVISVRVQGELDFATPEVFKTATSAPTVTTSVMT